jgi:hypothetical protein
MFPADATANMGIPAAGEAEFEAPTPAMPGMAMPVVPGRAVVPAL